MKETAEVRSIALDRQPPLNRLRSITVAVVICLAFAAAIYLAIG